MSDTFAQHEAGPAEEPSASAGPRPANRTYVRAHAHLTIPMVMLRADLSEYPDVTGVSIGLDLTAEQARSLAAQLLVAASALDERGDA